MSDVKNEQKVRNFLHNLCGDLLDGLNIKIASNIISFTKKGTDLRFFLFVENNWYDRQIKGLDIDWKIHTNLCTNSKNLTHNDAKGVRAMSVLLENKKELDLFLTKHISEADCV